MAAVILEGTEELKSELTMRRLGTHQTGGIQVRSGLPHACITWPKRRSFGESMGKPETRQAREHSL